MMKVAPILLILTVSFHSLIAQNKPITISGMVVESTSQHPREFATIKLLDAQQQLITRTITQPNFYLYNYRQQGRFITFGITFGFGKGETMEFSGQKRF